MSFIRGVAAGKLDHEIGSFFLYASDFTFINGSDAVPSTLFFEIDSSYKHDLTTNLTKFEHIEQAGLSELLADPSDYMASFTGFDEDGTLLQFGGHVVWASSDHGSVLELNFSQPINLGCPASDIEAGDCRGNASAHRLIDGFAAQLILRSRTKFTNCKANMLHSSSSAPRTFITDIELLPPASCS